jgi:spermidine synthase
MEGSYNWHWFIEWGTPTSAHMYGIEKVLYHGRSKYQDIMVAFVKDLGKALILDGKTQSALSDEFVYHESLVHPAMILHSNPRKVLVLGGGEGATIREVFRFDTVERVVMVDIDEEVINVSKKYLQEWHQGAFNDPRLELLIMDGIKYIEETKEKFDVIIADLADPLEAGPAYKLYTKEYYEKIKSLLNPGGVFVTQATSPTITPFTHAVIYNTIKETFKYTAIYHVYVKSFDGVWGFAIASDEKDPRELTKEKVDDFLRKHIKGQNKFYDGSIHEAVFTIPRYLKEKISNIKDIATLDKPVFMPA